MANVGEVHGNKHYQRCEYCGDSEKHPNRAHKVVHLESGFWRCYRCGAEGQLSLNSLVQLLFSLPQRQRVPLPDPLSHEELETLPNLNGAVPGMPDGARPSGVLPRYHLLTEDGHIDIFGSRDALGMLTGYHFRPSWVKAMRTVGKPSLGYGMSLLPPPGQANRLRIVEGPYDVVTSSDVAVFGLPKPSHARLLGMRELILCPDGDALTKSEVALAWYKAFKDSNVKLVEVLPPGRDPDEVPPERRLRFTWREWIGTTGIVSLRSSLAAGQRALEPTSGRSWFAKAASWQ